MHRLLRQWQVAVLWWAMKRWLVPLVVLPGTALVFVPAVLLLAEGGPRASSGLRLAAGLLALFPGAWLAISAMRMFARHGEGTAAPWDPPTKLVLHGPYRFVRNPMISGVVFLLVAEACLLGSAYIMSWAAVFWLGNNVYFPLVEEPKLRERFGEDYERYCQHVRRWWPRLRPWQGLLLLWLPLGLRAAEAPAPIGVEALGRQLRVDLRWEGPTYGWEIYQVRRADRADGEFELLPYHSRLPVFTDFVGEGNKTCFYQVRTARTRRQHIREISPWSPVVSATTKVRSSQNLLAEVQEAAVRYFTVASHPESGLANEWYNPRLWPSQDWSRGQYGACGATGMGLANFVVAAERGYISREEAATHTLRALRFLDQRAERFHGAYPHWIHNHTGKAIPFSRYDDGGDLAETALLIQGVIIAREYFAADSANEREIRVRANRIWQGVDWNWYRRDGGPLLYWHWSPKHAWEINMPIHGFCEVEIAYLLGIASPTHPIPVSCYFEGWRGRHFSHDRRVYEIDLQLGRGLGGCTFWYYYSHLGLDPGRIHFRGRPMTDHFRDLCAVQVAYMRSRAHEFTGYDRMWGLTASPGPDGYRAFKPGKLDDGTIGPTASLSAYLYAPRASQQTLETMYYEHGKTIWRELGFVESFNPTRDWAYDTYLGIDAGTVAPMIENYRSGLLWKLFMNAPEIKQALQSLEAAQPGTVR